MRLLRVLLSIGLPIILSQGCSLPSKPESPKAPTWDVNFTLPLSDYTYKFSKLESSNLHADEEGIFHITYHAALEQISFATELELDPAEPITFSQIIGEITINSPGSQEIPRVTLNEMTGGLYSEWQGTQVAAIPSLTLPTIEKELPAFEDFDKAIIKQGTIEVTVKNNTIIYLGNPLTVTIESRKPDIPFKKVVRLDIPIPPGGQQSQAIDIAGSALSNEMRVTVEGSSIGSNGQPVIIDLESYYTVAVSISELQVLEAQAKIPQQNFQMSNASVLDEKIQVRGASIKSGGLTIDLNNRLPVDANVTVRIPALTQDGNQFERELYLRADTPGQITFIDLNNYVIGDFTGQTTLTSLEYNLSVSTIDTRYDNNPDPFATIAASDFVEASVALDALTFYRLKGNIIKGRLFEIPSTKQGLGLGNLPKGQEKDWITFKDIELSVRTIGLDNPVTLDVLVVGERYDDNGYLEERSEADTTVVVSRESPDFFIEIGDVISITPDSVEISGTATIRGPVDMTDEDYIEGTVEMDAPVTFRLKHSIIEVGKLSEREIGEDMRKVFDNKEVKYVRLIGELENHNPLSGAVLILASPDSTAFSSPPEAEADTLLNLKLPQPLFNADGTVAEPGYGPISVELDTVKFEIFRNPLIYVKTEVVLDGTETQENPLGWVSLRSTDYIRVLTKAGIELKVDLERLTEKKEEGQ